MVMTSLSRTSPRPTAGAIVTMPCPAHTPAAKHHAAAGIHQRGANRADSHAEPASGDDDLAADEIRFRETEEQHRASGFLRCAGAPERNEALHRLDLRRIQPNLELALADLDLGGRARVCLGQAGLDEAE